MARAKIDNPLFSKTEGKSESLKLLDSKTDKVEKSKTLKEPEVKESKSLKVSNFKTEEPKEFKSSKVLESKTQGNGEDSKSLKLPKFKTCDQQLLVRLRPEQAEFLGRLESTIMKARSKENRKERITKNTIIRSAIDMLQNMEIDHSEISGEEKLLERMMQLLRSSIKKD